MVAKIKSGKSLTGALNYNENKVKAGKAELIWSNGYVNNLDKLTFHDKQLRLTDLAQRNLRTKTNAVHISLNFHVDEKIDRERLIEVADEYMRRIGFGDQPYLIYKHSDAGHPHVHIVTTNIQSSGKRISLHHIGELASEPAREAIENDFGLVKAKGQQNTYQQSDQLPIVPVEYSKTDTKRAITNVVNSVTKAYKYTSLPELNAILNFYNITADKGSKESVMFKNGGLNYWIIDQKGQKIGVPIKASSIYQKPTLKLLEGRFKLNGYLRKPFKEQFKSKINNAIGASGSLADLKAELKKKDIAVLVRQNDEGRIYGLSYIDHKNKVIFNGSDLGKMYSAAGILDALQNTGSKRKIVSKNLFQPPSQAVDHHSGRPLLDELLNPFDPNQSQPNQFGPRRKKKKRRNLNL